MAIQWRRSRSHQPPCSGSPQPNTPLSPSTTSLRGRRKLMERRAGGLSGSDLPRSPAEGATSVAPQAPFSVSPNRSLAPADGLHLAVDPFRTRRQRVLHRHGHDPAAGILPGHRPPVHPGAGTPSTGLAAGDPFRPADPGAGPGGELAAPRAACREPWPGGDPAHHQPGPAAVLRGPEHRSGSDTRPPFPGPNPAHDRDSALRAAAGSAALGPGPHRASVPPQGRSGCPPPSGGGHAHGHLPTAHGRLRQ